MFGIARSSTTLHPHWQQAMHEEAEKRGRPETYDQGRRPCTQQEPQAFFPFTGPSASSFPPSHHGSHHLLTDVWQA